MATSCSPSIPEKSAGLHVYTGRSCATAIGRDHGVVRSGRGLATSAAQRCGHLAERTGGLSIERKRIEISLCLLQVRLARGTLAIVAGDKRSHGELRERHRCDERLSGKRRGVGEP
jgi:hypothetical protein